jgi:NADPH-dependent glutamate synthase beta subunit-like oxidoreductase
VCHHPCEQACISGSIQRTPAIRELKKFASMAVRPEIKRHTGPQKGRAAVIGAGPAGLAAAWALSRNGAQVKVFEDLPVPGGLPAWAIPPFRLPRRAVQEDVNYILQHGVELQLNTRLSPEEVMHLRSEFDAVVLACGAPMPKQTGIPGSRLPRVLQGLDFLRQLAFGPVPQLRPPVVVIGGGNVATDAARCAVRLAPPVQLMYRRDREEMPAYPDEVDASMAEGIDFIFRTQPIGFEGGPQRGVRQIRLQTTAPGSRGEDGRRSFAPLDGTEKIIPAGTVILALGQERGMEQWTEGFGMGKSDPAPDGFLTDRIYAAGDMVNGPATVVEAIASGINCARRIMREVFA